MAEPRILIVCPKSVMRGWVSELWRHAELFGELIEGTTKQRQEALSRDGGGIRITNYESLIYTGDSFEKIPWDVVVLDEIHRVKGFSNKTSKAVRKLTAKARYVWGLSGTPSPQGLEDWCGVLSAIDPKLLPVQTKTAFEARYCVKQAIGPDGAPPFKIVGYRNVQELHGYIARVTSRVTKEECLADLPPKVFLTRTCQLEGEQARLYRDLKKDAVARIKTARGDGTLSIRNVLQESLRLLQVVGGHFPTDDGQIIKTKEQAKLESLFEAIEECGDKPIVVWCCFLPEVKLVTDWLRDEYRSQVSNLVGEMNTDDRAASLGAFASGDARFFVGTAAAGGTGINELVVSDTEIYYSRNYVLVNYLQSIDRLHRLGQKKSVSVVKLIATGTTDDKVDLALDRKEELQEMLLRQPEDML